MNGRSDTGEMFYHADFQSNFTFAQSVGLGRSTNWSVNRDRQCPGGANTVTSGTCSSIVQSDWDFTKCSVQFAGNGAANFAQLELWDCNGVGGQQWVPQANGSVKNPQSDRCIDSPGGSTTNGARLQIYDCNASGAQVLTSSGFTALPACTAAAYSSSVIYTNGMSVSYQGHKWTAKWWTQGEAPSTGGSGVWADNGPC